MTKALLHLTDISFAALLFIMFYTIGDGLSEGVVLVCMAIFCYTVLKSYLNPVVFVDGRKSLVNAEILLYVFFYILFFHPYIEAAFFDFNLQYHSKFDREYIHESNQAIIVSTLAVLGFSAGTWLIMSRPKAVNLQIQPPSRNFPAIVFVLFTLSIVLFMLLGGSNWIFSYYDRRMQTGTGLLNQVYMFACWLSAVAIGSSLFSVHIRQANMFVYFNLALVFVWLLVLLMIGNRNMLLLTLVVILAFVSLYYIRIRSLVILGLLAFALLAYNAIAEVRRAPDKSLALILSEVVNPRHATGITETNFSTQTTIVRATINITPDPVGYFFGNFTFQSVLGIVPYSRSMLLWWTDAPSTSSEIVRSFTLGDHANHGTGTTIISDLYLDFGVFYVFLGMAMLGMLWGLIKNRAQRFPLSHDNVIMYLIAVTALAQCGRYGLPMPVRFIGWMLILIIIARLFSKKPFAGSRKTHQNSKGHGQYGYN